MKEEIKLLLHNDHIIVEKEFGTRSMSNSGIKLREQTYVSQVKETNLKEEMVDKDTTMIVETKKDDDNDVHSTYIREEFSCQGVISLHLLQIMVGLTLMLA